MRNEALQQTLANIFGMIINSNKFHVKVFLEALIAKERDGINDKRGKDCRQSKVFGTNGNALDNALKIAFKILIQRRLPQHRASGLSRRRKCFQKKRRKSPNCREAEA